MYIKKFTDVDEANQFINSVIVSEKGGIQYYDGDVIVFYECEKDNYQSYFVGYMIERLEDNLFNEKVKLMTIEAELEVFKEKGANVKGYDDAKERQRETEKNIDVMQAKLDVLNEWKAKNSSNA